MDGNSQVARLGPKNTDATGGVRPLQAAGKAQSVRSLVVKLAEGECPKCGTRCSFAGLEALDATACAECGHTFMVPGRLPPFVLTRRLGEGEMGQIFRARDLSLDREVAIKVVHEKISDDASQIKKLQQEAQAAARVSHPNVAHIYSLGFVSGHPYLVMELATGEDVEARLKAQGRLEEREVLKLAIEITSGLVALHNSKLTHGDIKPANIVISRDGVAKLVDFGLAGTARRSEDGSVRGTPHYLAPELARGQMDTPLSDLYSLGATLYFLLTGKPPFQGKTPEEVIQAKLVAVPVSVGKLAPETSAGMRKIVTRLLARDPDRRYANGEELLGELTAMRDHNGPGARKTADATAAGTAYPETPFQRRIRLAILVVLALAALAVMLQNYQAAQYDAEPSGARADEALAVAALGGEEPTAEAVGEIGGLDIDGVGPPSFGAHLPTEWFSVDIGDELRGSTTWFDKNLILLSNGAGIIERSDSCRYVHSGISGDFTLSVEIAANRAPVAGSKAGLMVRTGSSPTATALFFGRLGDGRLQVSLRYDSTIEVIETSEEPVFLPQHIQLARKGESFDFFISADGRHWSHFAGVEMGLTRQLRVGFALASYDESTASVEFREIALRGP